MDFAVITVEDRDVLYQIVNAGEAAFIAQAREQMGFDRFAVAECERMFQQLVAVAHKAAKQETRAYGGVN